MKVSKKATAGFAVLALALTGFSSSMQIGNAATSSSKVVTKGPNGESATPCAKLIITAQQRAAAKKGRFTAALLWHSSNEFVDAVNAGASDRLKQLGIKVVATGNAEYDVAKQKANIENAMAKKPSLIMSLPFDGVAAAAAYKPAVDAGTKLVFLSNTPDKFVAGKQYVAIVTDDLAQMGIQAADALAKAVGSKGEVGYIYHDATYYVTNQRDQAFKSRIETKYPNMKIVDSEGIADPAKGLEIAQAMLTKHPNLAGIYVTWSQPAEGVLAALKAVGNTKTKIVTLDLSEPLAVDMVKGGNVASITADKAYALGTCMATAGAIGLVKGHVPPFLIVPALTVTKNNVEKGWKDSLNKALPAAVKTALGK